MRVLVVMAVFLSACGQSGGTGNKPGSGVAQYTLTEQKDPGGASTHNTETIAISGSVNAPLPTEITVYTNGNDTFNAALEIGSVTCSYTHNIGDGNSFGTFNGCSGPTPVAVSPGDLLQINIPTGVTQVTNIGVTVTIQ
jgi:hypothetical protein